MSSKNDDTMGISVVIAVIAMVGIFVAAFLAAFALFLTIVSIIAWNKPLRFGNWTTVYPHEARAFVLRGVIGGAFVPFAIALLDLATDLPINWDYWLYFVLFGYVAGSVGVGMMMAEEMAARSNTVDITPPQIPTATPKALPRP